MTPDGPVEVFDNCSTSIGLNASALQEEFKDTPIYALKKFEKDAQKNEERGENPSEYYMENGWNHEHKNPYHENEHEDNLHNHHHLGEDGFFCNHVGMSFIL